MSDGSDKAQPLPASPEELPAEDPPAGEGRYPEAVETLFADKKRSRRGVPWISVVAGSCGLAGLAVGPFLIAGTPGRYLILLADIVALTLGGIGLWAAIKYRARFDWAVLGLVTGVISLVFYVAYVTDPPTTAGGT